jgi:putative sterol carrier protein
MKKMVNPFTALDTCLGRKFAPLLIKSDLRGHRAIGFTEQDALSRMVYNHRAKDWKRYGITLEDIRKVVDSEMDIKPVSGLKAKIGLFKAKSAIRQAIKDKRLVFISDNQVDYTDKNGANWVVSYYRLADIFIGKVGVGFKPDVIVKILLEERQKIEFQKKI